MTLTLMRPRRVLAGDRGQTPPPRTAARAQALFPAALALLVGCRTMPPAAPSPRAAAVAEQAAQSAPTRFRALSTVTFAFLGRSFSGLGVVDVDASTRSFSVVGLNHLGAKLFEIEQTNGVVVTASALPIFEERGDFAGTVAADIARVYFDLVPSPSATAYPAREGTWLVEPAGDGAVERRLDPQGRLLEKRFRTGRRIRWSVRYSDYREESGRWHAGVAELRNRRQRYALTVRLKQLLK